MFWTCGRTLRHFCAPPAAHATRPRLHQVYYIFGVLFVVFGILVVTCAEITVVLVYFQLCSEDYRWWWRAFFTSGSSALYLFLYSAFYFVTKLEITKLVSTLMYFGKPRRCTLVCAHTETDASTPGYMLILSVSFFLMTGAPQSMARARHANHAEGDACSRAGTVGFLACLLFVHVIYGSVKID